MNYKEVPDGASRDDQQKYATGIARMANLADELYFQGRLLEKFSSEHFRFHASLEGKVSTEPIVYGGKSPKELLRNLGRKKINIGSEAQLMVESVEFSTIGKPETREIAVVRVGDLVLNPKGSDPTTAEIDVARGEKGFEEVPAEAALQYLLQRGDKLQLGDAIWFSMKTIADRGGCPSVLGVERGVGGLWLSSTWARPEHMFFPNVQFAFGVPASK